MVEMAGALPEIGFEQRGAYDNLVPAAQMFTLFKGFEDLPKHGAFGVVNHHTCPNFVSETEEVQFFPETTVVSSSCFFQKMEILLQSFRIAEGSSVDALEHSVAFVPPPVGAGDAG